MTFPVTMTRLNIIHAITGLIVTGLLSGCGTTSGSEDPLVKIKSIDNKGNAPEIKREALSKLIGLDGRLNDSTRLFQPKLTDSFYRPIGYGNVWSIDKNWKPVCDSLYKFIENAKGYGLYPASYHYFPLRAIRERFSRDSASRDREETWSDADLLLTDACIHLFNDLRYGRLNQSIQYDSSKSKKEFLLTKLTQLINEGNLAFIVAELEPKSTEYQSLRKALPAFVGNMDKRAYTYVPFPYDKKNEGDSLKFIRSISQRLRESGCIDYTKKLPDSTALADALKKYQQQKQLKPTGKVDAALIKNMNTTDAARFEQIAITLDKYKELNYPLPEKYILVNLPAYRLQLWDKDKLALESKIICGKPSTRTPVLQSELTDMVIYPTWTVPNSIIVKQYLPRLKNNPHYLSRLGLQLYGANGRPINPASINWQKYSKGIPYKIMQNSGDRNALGVLKFNFKNDYAVYLHDTNQRYLFKNSMRALSHGCVRVEKWDSLAYYMARNDSISLKPGDTLRYNTDSLKQWLSKKQYRRVDIQNRIPLFISYFSCEASEGNLIFHEDIYGEDRDYRIKYFQPLNID